MQIKLYLYFTTIMIVALSVLQSCGTSSEQNSSHLASQNVTDPYIKDCSADNYEKKENVEIFRHNSVYGLSFTPDERFVAVRSYRYGTGDVMRIWDTKSQECFEIYPHLSNPDDQDSDLSSYGMTFTPDGKYFVIGYEDEKIKIYDHAKRELKHIFNYGYGSYGTFHFSKDGTIMFGGTDFSSSSFDMVNWKPIKQYRSVHTSNMAVTSDNKTLVTGDTWQGGLRVFDVETGKIKEITYHGGATRKLYLRHGGGVQDIVMSHDEKYFISSANDHKPSSGIPYSHTTYKIWNTQTGDMLKTLPNHSKSRGEIRLSPDDRFFVTMAEENTKLDVWTFPEGRLLRTLDNQGDSFLEFDLSPDGKWIATGSETGKIRFFDIASGKLIQTLDAHTDKIRRIKYASDGKSLYTGAYDKTLKRWKLK